MFNDLLSPSVFYDRPCRFFLMLPRSYSDIIIEREVLMQKYIHLVQIMETEKIAANQLRTQLEDQDTEIERLKAEVCMKASTYACACIYKSTCGRACMRWHSHWRHVHVSDRAEETLDFKA